MKTINKNKTTMKVNEQIAIMQAYEDGKTIEGKRYEETEWKSLEYVENYPFDFFGCKYRIKPMDNYRPYESIKEAFAEAKKHGFWVRQKDSQYWTTVDYLRLDKSGTIYINGFKSYDYLHGYVWVDDGSPCGVKIE